MAQPSSARPRRLRAVVVDDDAEMRAVLMRFLARLEIDTSCEFKDGVSALKGLESLDPHFIVTDLAMSPMDGLEFARAFRSSTKVRNNEIPIIAVTGHAHRQHVEAARDAGINEFISKPVTLAVLRSRIEALSQPRKFVKAVGYVGPCRRRRKTAQDGSPKRRATDAVEV